MHSNHQYTSAIESERLKTLAVDYTPGNISKIDLSDFKLSENSNTSVDILVTWEPASDRTCHYYIYAYDQNEENDNMNPDVITKVIDRISL